MRSALRPLAPSILAAIALAATLVVWIRWQPVAISRAADVLLAALLVGAVAVLLALVIRAAVRRPGPHA